MAKKETEEILEYQLRNGVWYGGWVVSTAAFLACIALWIFLSNVLIGILGGVLLGAWVVVVIVSWVPVIRMLSPSTLITRENGRYVFRKIKKQRITQ